MQRKRLEGPNGTIGKKHKQCFIARQAQIIINGICLNLNQILMIRKSKIQSSQRTIHNFKRWSKILKIGHKEEDVIVKLLKN